MDLLLTGYRADSAPRSRAETPSDAEWALACYRQGLDIAHHSGDITSGNLNLVGIVYTETRLRTPTTADACNEAITRLYDTRHWSGFWLALGAVTAWWVAIGNPERGRCYPRSHRRLPPSLERRRPAPARASGSAPTSGRFPADGPRRCDHLVSFVLDQLAVAPTEPTSDSRRNRMTSGSRSGWRRR